MKSKSYEFLLRQIGSIIPNDPNSPAYQAMQELWSRLIIDRKRIRKLRRRPRRERSGDTTAQAVSDAAAFPAQGDSAETVQAMANDLIRVMLANPEASRSEIMGRCYNLASFKRSSDKLNQFHKLYQVASTELMSH